MTYQQFLIRLTILLITTGLTIHQIQAQADRSNGSVKLLIEQSDLYNLTYHDLQTISPDLVATNPHHLELSHRQEAIPVWFEGDEDDQFEAGERFIFYGQAIDNPYSRYNVYWLQAVNRPGLRMAPGNGTPNGQVSPTTFANRQHYEENRLYWAAPPDGQGKDHWFWDKFSVVNGQSVIKNYHFDLAHIAPDGPAGEIVLMLYGSSFSDYRLQLSLNGTALLPAGGQIWSGRRDYLLAVPVPQNLFQEGSNQLQIESLPPADSDHSEFYLNWFTVTYEDTYTAEDDQLTFSAPKFWSDPLNIPAVWTGSYTITNLTTPDLHLFDISQPTAPLNIRDSLIEPQGAGYQLRFSFSQPGVLPPQHRFILQATSDLRRPIIKPATTTNWQSPHHGATYLIITHPDFYEAVQPLATYRQAQGESVAVITTEELYDEFNAGIYHPQAIRDFLVYAYANWSPRPVYLLLVGDASLDPKNYRGNSLPDRLPAYYLDTPLYGQAPIDHWYATVSGADALPDLIIGRLPVQSVSQLHTMIDKIQHYEQNPPAVWAQQALLVAHNETPSFAADMEMIANLLPANIQPTKFYEPTINDQPIHEQIERTINEGRLLVAYSGHGHETVWAKNYTVFEASQVNQLTNGYRLPVVTSANCLTGFFAGYQPTFRNPSLAEALLFHPNGGAIAVWAPASYGFPTPNTILQRQFYQTLINQHPFQPGRAATTAQIQAYHQAPHLLSFFQTFNYLGDPALRLTLPQDTPITGLIANDDSPTPLGQPTNFWALTVNGREAVFTWDLGDGSAPQTGPTIQHSYAQLGRYTVQVTATNNLGSQTTTRQVTIIEPPPPVISVTTPQLAGQLVNFSSTVTGTGMSYQWTTGDGRPAVITTSPKLSYTYAAPGRYTATLQLFHPHWQSEVVSQVVEILLTPTARFTTNAPHPVGLTTYFTSTSLAGGDQPANLTYQWNLGDGSLRATQQPSHTYTNIGQYVVMLTVSNRLARDTITGLVEVTDQPVQNLQVATSSPTQLGEPTFLTATLTGTNLIYQWDLGEGSFTQTTSGLMSHIYPQIGVYTVRLTVENSISRVTQTIPLTITDIPPVAKFNYDQDVVAGATIFTTTFINLSTGSNVIYQWDFGDGESIITTSTLSLTHPYTDSGTYRVTLTATNTAGLSVVSQLITIVREVQQPVANFTVNRWLEVGQWFTPTNLSYDGGDRAEQVTYHWQWGDAVGVSGWQPTHHYTAVGAYTVSLTVENSVSFDTTSQPVIVTDVPVRGVRLSVEPTLLVSQMGIFSAEIAGGTNVSYQWNLDGGTVMTGTTLTDPVVWPIYETPGQYTVSLTVKNSVSQETISQTITVIDQPVTGLAIRHDGPTELGQVTTLTATVETGTQVAYQWDLGDGTTSQQPMIEHTYDQPGRYTVSLTATNVGSHQITYTLVEIFADPPTGLQITPGAVEIGQPIVFTATVNRGTPPLTYGWDWGDGTFSTGPQSSHRYDQPGRYTITLVATNLAGQEVVSQTIELTRYWLTFLPLLQQ